MSVEDGIKRFNAEISIDLDKRIKKCIPWGTQAEVMRKLLEALVDAVDERGAIMVHHILQGEVKLAIVVPSTVQSVNTSADSEDAKPDDGGIADHE